LGQAQLSPEKNTPQKAGTETEEKSSFAQCNPDTSDSRLDHLPKTCFSP
jgi:hypothetical protein